MTSKQYVTRASVAAAVLCAAVLAANLRIDLYGLFRPIGGRRLLIYGEERTAKYLFSYRYIPSAFNGILLGPSLTDNLPTRRLSAYRVYNASINGGNVTELSALARNAFGRTRFAVTIVALHRYITKDHGLKRGLMKPREYWTALGSPQLLMSYVNRALDAYGSVSRNPNDEYGTFQYNVNPSANTAREAIESDIEAIRSGRGRVSEVYDIDPVAYEELDDLLAAARAHSRRVVVFYPPFPEPILQLREGAYRDYQRRIAALLKPEDEVVDFTQPKYRPFRLDYSNFNDGVHFSGQGAEVLVRELDQVLSAASAEESSPQRR